MDKLYTLVIVFVVFSCTNNKGNYTETITNKIITDSSKKSSYNICSDTFKLSELLSFIERVYNTDSLTNEAVDTSRNNDYFFISCNHFKDSITNQILLILEKKFNRLAVVNNGCKLFLIDSNNGKFNILLSESCNGLSKKDIIDLTNDGVVEIINRGNERFNDHCTNYYSIFNFKGLKINYLFDAWGYLLL